MSQQEDSLDLAKAESLYLEVEDSLEIRQSLPWGLTAKALNAAKRCLYHEQTVQFLNSFLLRMIETLTNQDPRIVGMEERRHIDDAINCALEVIIKFGPGNLFLPVLCRILNPFTEYYFGKKVNYVMIPGVPAARIAAAKHFVELEGFGYYYTHFLMSPDFRWDSEQIYIFLKALAETSSYVDEELRINWVTEVARKLLGMTEESLKKENIDYLVDILSAISSVQSSKDSMVHLRRQCSYHSFWMKFTLKLINCNSLVLRLCGWDQIQSISKKALRTRPKCDSYTVTGAGFDAVNGVYTFLHSDANDFGVYFKPPSGPSAQGMTLFRCLMNSKSYTWFISHVPPGCNPGTSRDIDYYERPVDAHDDSELPQSGWVSSGIRNQLTMRPFPTIVPSQKLLIPEGADEELYLINHFQNWIKQQPDLITSAFASPHREILSRCSKLLLLLTKLHFLETNILSVTWKTVTSSQDADIVKVLIDMMVGIFVVIDEQMFSAFVQIILDSLRQETVTSGASSTSSSAQNISPVYSKAALLIEKMAKSELISVVSKSESSATKLLSLVWAVYRNAQFEALKNKKAIHSFLSGCFAIPFCTDTAITAVQECLEQLQSPTTTELVINQTLEMLEFLVSKTLSKGSLGELEENNYSECIIEEVQRFVRVNRNQSTFSQCWYVDNFNKRLQILFKFYEYAELKFPLAKVQQLWVLVNQEPIELNSLFNMFYDGLSARGIRNSFMAPKDLLNIFVNYICCDSVDWAQLNETSFSCFKSYYKVLENYDSFAYGSMDLDDMLSSPIQTGKQLPPYLGLDTLWKIALNSTLPNVKSSAASLLIKTYEDMRFSQQDVHIQFIDRIFAIIENSVETIRSRSSDRQSCLQQIGSGVELLYQIIIKSKPSIEPSHSMRSSLQAMKLHVSYRRVQEYYNFNTNMNSMRAEKGSEATYTVEVHPLSNLKALKQKIAFAVGNCTLSCNVQFDGLLANAEGISLLQDHGIKDGHHVSAYSAASVYMNSMLANKRRSNYSIDDDNLDDDIAILPSAADYISSHQTFFDKLCELATSMLQEYSSDNVSSILERVWTIIMLLPTQHEMLESFLIASSDSSSPCFSWQNVLSTNSVVKQAYLLQVLDYVLQPAVDIQDEYVLTRAENFKEAFLSSDGYAVILDILLELPDKRSRVTEDALAAVLHILYFLTVQEAAAIGQGSIAITPSLPDTKTEPLIAKLLSSARNAAECEDCNIVHSSLAVLTSFLSSKAVSSVLINDGSSRSLLLMVLRSSSETVRNLACDFAVQLGKSQSVVFNWLREELMILKPKDSHSSQLFNAMVKLIRHLYMSDQKSVDWPALGAVLASRICSFPSESEVQQSVNDKLKSIMTGYMKLLEELIKTDSKEISFSQIDFDKIVQLLLEVYLFPFPTSENSSGKALCETADDKSTAFALIKAIVMVRFSAFISALQSIEKINAKASESTQKHWGLQPSFEARADIPFVGLKNQGCTCYMNSLLQQLFMNVEFREAILAAPLRECDRTSISHRTPQSLIGVRISLEWPNNVWREAKVLEYDATSGYHSIEYGPNDVATFDLSRGRTRQELGNVRIAPVEGDEPATEREEAAYRVLDQLQRCFYFLKHSKRRYYDPKPFVDACKSLNMNFSVYQQNDASEFCDQLLDRISIATKGKHTGIDVWTDTIEKYIFGGKFLYQKIPTDCETYTNDKSKCGHWQSSRQESFLKIELNIKGKESIYDSISDLVAGELMDGDNKINCEVCTQKKATIRRTCLDVLPNMLIVHLKRFDLDFTTFETVKLNSRLSFDRKIGLMKYTKEGIESVAPKEVIKEGEAAKGKVSMMDEALGEDEDAAVDKEAVTGGPAAVVSKIEQEDYEYQLQGVLVHAGVAQGGHYYSYACQQSSGDNNSSDSSEEHWFSFDDEDVSEFNPDYIPLQCFGGSSNSGSAADGSSPARGNLDDSFGDNDRRANALMLFYTKVRPVKPDAASNVTATPIINTTANDRSVSTKKGSVILTGNEAYKREVEAKNLVYLTARYSLDPALQEFIRDLLNCILSSYKHHSQAKTSGAAIASTNLLKWYPPKDSSKTTLAVVQSVCKYIFDVVLHCRERTAMKQWSAVLKATLTTFKDCAWWLIRHMMNSVEQPSWFDIYMQNCVDSLARNTFVQIVSYAVSALGTGLPDDCLLPYLVQKESELRALFKKKPPSDTPDSPSILSLLALLVSKTVEKLTEVPLFARVSDELFALIRELSSVSCVRRGFLQFPTISIMGYYLLPGQASERIMSLIENKMKLFRLTAAAAAAIDYTSLAQNIFEAIAALLGVPQIKKVSLLQDRSLYESELVYDARDALTTIFNEQAATSSSVAAVAGSGAHLTASDIVAYKEKTGTKIGIQQAKIVIDRFGGNDGRLYLDGFLQYYTDSAFSNAKEVWKDLHAFGYRNDLTRARTAVTGAAATSAASAPSTASSSSSSSSASGTSSSVVVGSPDEQLGKLDVLQDCRKLLFNMKLYQIGLDASEASAKAIARRLCVCDKIVSQLLLRQILNQIATVSTEWNYSSYLTNLVDLLRVILSIDDGFVKERSHEVLVNATVGLVPIAVEQSTKCLQCRANEYDKKALFKRYISFVQDLYSTVPTFAAEFTSLAETNSSCQFVKGFLKIRPDSLLTENEEQLMRSRVVRVVGAGVKAVDGEYVFSGLLQGAGRFIKKGEFQDRPATFHLYKCAVGMASHQWFISIPPEDSQPGTSNDIDFYYAPAGFDVGVNAMFPPSMWSTLNNQYSNGPAPTIVVLDKSKSAEEAIPLAPVRSKPASTNILPPPPPSNATSSLHSSRRSSQGDSEDDKGYPI